MKMLVALLALLLTDCAGGRRHPLVAVHIINVEQPDTDHDEVAVRRAPSRRFK